MRAPLRLPTVLIYMAALIATALLCSSADEQPSPIVDSWERPTRAVLVDANIRVEKIDGSFGDGPMFVAIAKASPDQGFSEEMRRITDWRVQPESNSIVISNQPKSDQTTAFTLDSLLLQKEPSELLARTYSDFGFSQFQDSIEFDLEGSSGSGIYVQFPVELITTTTLSWLIEHDRVLIVGSKLGHLWVMRLKCARIK